MSQQYELIHESIEDALREVIAALGGPKVVGPRLRGESIAIEAARTWLLDCLNPDRRERLAPGHVLWLLREGRRIGCHAAMRYLAREAGYEAPRAIDPLDERAQLQRAYVAAVHDLAALAARLERLQDNDRPAIKAVS